MLFPDSENLKFQARPVLACGLVVFCAAVTGCQAFDYKQAAYSALRHDDCLRNEVNTYCSRAHFQNEYNEYERLRNEFLEVPNPVADEAARTAISDPSADEREVNTSTDARQQIWPHTPKSSTTL